MTANAPLVTAVSHRFDDKATSAKKLREIGTIITLANAAANATSRRTRSGVKGRQR